MRRRLVFLLVFAAIGSVGLISCNVTRSSKLKEVPGSSNEVTISILGLNDLHGGGLSANSSIAVGTASDRHSVKIGGPAAMKAYFSAVKAGNPGGTLLLDAADSYQGSLVSNNSRGQAVVSLYKFLEVDASAIGNHEFDWGGILAPTQEGQNSYDSPFLRIVEKATYPFLAHNMTFRNGPLEEIRSLIGPGGKPYSINSKGELPKLGSYAMFNRNGVKIAVVGGITKTAMASSSKENYRDVAIRPIGEGLGELAKKLRVEKGAQIVVLLMHAGFSCGFSNFDYSDDTKNTSADCPEVTPGSDEVREIFAQLKADGFAPHETIDVVVAGHVHAPQAHYYDQVPVIQNADKGLGFGRVDLKFNKSENKITARKIFPPTLFCHSHFENYTSCNPNGPSMNNPPPPLLGQEVAAVYEGRKINLDTYSTKADEAMAPFKDLIAEKDRPITTLAEGLIHDRFKESAMSLCYVDAIKLAAGVDVVIAISGGIRESLPKGDVTAGSIFEVAPFDGGAVVVSVTGAELKRYIEMQNKDFNIKSMPIISDGWKLKVACSAPGEAVTPKDIFEYDRSNQKWKAVNPDKTYKLLVSGYLFENPFFDEFRASRSKVIQSDRELLTAGFSRADRPESCNARTQEIKKCDDSHARSRWCGLTQACPSL